MYVKRQVNKRKIRKTIAKAKKYFLPKKPRPVAKCPYKNNKSKKNKATYFKIFDDTLKDLESLGSDVIKYLSGSSTDSANSSFDPKNLRKYGLTLAPNGDILVGNNITITGSEDFKLKTLDRLMQIGGTTSGKETLDNITLSGKKITIIETTVDNSFAGWVPNGKDKNGNSLYLVADIENSVAKGKKVYDGNNEWLINGKPLIGTGLGADVQLQFNPNLKLRGIANALDPMPNDAILFHELVHASHIMHGQLDNTPTFNEWDNLEEKTTISTGKPSETDYLRERGYKFHRIDHSLGFVENSKSGGGAW